MTTVIDKSSFEDNNASLTSSKGHERLIKLASQLTFMLASWAPSSYLILAQPSNNTWFTFQTLNGFLIGLSGKTAWLPDV